jgi:hypothetical protein
VSQRVTIGSLPDNALLDIFYFYQGIIVINKYKYEHPWGTLVHVCQRWRYLVFESPIRLDLHLFCTKKTPVKKLLSVWPASLPIAIYFYCSNDEWEKFLDLPAADDLVAALERRDRVRHIRIINTEGYLWNEIVPAMQGPFPILRSLWLNSVREVLTLPDTFLNGSVSRLQQLYLRKISFPSLPWLLLSTSDLTSLRLIDIPSHGYISPVTMAECLSALPMLKSLDIIFESRTPQFKRRNLPVPPQTRFILPALTKLEFRGVSEYLEVLAARTDAPLLDDFRIAIFHQPVFDIPEIIRFFGHTKSLRSSGLSLEFSSYQASIFFSSSPRYMAKSCSWHIYSERTVQQIFSLAQICSQVPPFRSSVNTLIIESSSRVVPDNMGLTLWLQLFHSFPSVQLLTVYVELETFIAAALQGLTEESAAEVFPSLHRLSIVGNRPNKATEQGIQSFIAARQHSGHPVEFSRKVKAS